MAIFRQASSKTIVAKVFRDLGIQHQEWTLDAIEWIGEALEQIGASVELEDRSAVLPVSSFNAVLPDDLMLLEEVRYNSGNTDGRPDIFPDRLPHRRSSFSGSMRRTDGRREAVEDGYFVNTDVLQTSFASGWVQIHYKGMPLDDDGFPMVPDNASFSEAFLWYITKKLIMRGDNPNPTAFNYNYADQKWKEKCSQARSRANMPSPAEYESFMENWVRLIPDYGIYGTSRGGGDDTEYGTDTSDSETSYKDESYG